MVLAVTLLSLALSQPLEAPPAKGTPSAEQPAAAPPAPPPAAAPPSQPSPPTAPSGAGDTPTPATEPATRGDTNPEVILYMKDGSVFQGILLKEADGKFVLEIAGLPATFAADKVDHVRSLPPVLERYKELKAATSETDIEQRITLIRWLADRRQMEIALAEADLLAAKNPKHVGARKLAEDLHMRVDLLIKPARVENNEPNDAPPAAPSDGQIPPRDFPFLTEAQVAILKVYEIDLGTRPRVIFPREVAARMLEEYAASPLVPASREGKDAILRQDPLETVQLMFRLRARDYYEKVKVVDQPESMRRFRDDVQRVTLMGGCATSQCHGGRDAGRLVLSTYRPNNDLTLYTNFYILNNFKTSLGQPLIDWDKPEQSLLLQLALPVELSRFRHPPVMKDGKNVWRAPLTGTEDRRAKGIVDWIKSAYRPRPDYSLDYTPYRPFTPPPAPSVNPSPDAPLADPVVR